MASETAARRPVRPPTDFRALGVQAGAVTFVVLVIAAVIATTIANLTARGIPIGFDFLGGRAGFMISESILSYSPDDTNLWAIAVGIGNTLGASALVMLVSTLLGTLLGVARLSTNPLVSMLARTWIEAARNTPLLLLLLFVYTIWWTLPNESSTEIIPGVFASMRGVVIPGIDLPWSGRVTATAGGAFIVALGVARWVSTRTMANTGRCPPYLALTVAVGIALFLASATLGGGSLDWPKAGRTGPEGGISLTPETATLLAGLIFYTTGFIAEIVRTGINAVPKGQWEASRALGLSPGRILRLVIIPQMMRVIIPPMTSQYINVVKNSTLALAIGYSDFMVVMGTMINKTSRAVEGTVVIIVVYLVINLGLSALMNVYNRRVAIKER